MYVLLQLYVDLVMMLHEHMHLVDDFAGLLVSFQAVLCRCSISSHEHQKLHEYLTKLKVSFSVKAFLYLSSKYMKHLHFTSLGTDE